MSSSTHAWGWADCNRKLKSVANNQLSWSWRLGSASFLTMEAIVLELEAWRCFLSLVMVCAGRDGRIAGRREDKGGDGRRVQRSTGKGAETWESECPSTQQSKHTGRQARVRGETREAHESMRTCLVTVLCSLWFIFLSLLPRPEES